jgi:hypothetical protein
MLMEQNWRYRLDEFDLRVFDSLLPAEHPLLDTLERVPWEQFAPIVEAFYDPDRGQPAIKPLIMLKLEFLRYRTGLRCKRIKSELKWPCVFTKSKLGGYSDSTHCRRPRTTCQAFRMARYSLKASKCKIPLDANLGKKTQDSS